MYKKLVLSISCFEASIPNCMYVTSQIAFYFSIR